MAYNPDVYNQLDGSQYAYVNCVPATTTMLMDRDSVGKWRIPAPSLRKLSGDTSGGISYLQAAAVAGSASANEVKLTVMTSTRSGLKALVVAGHSVGVSIDCSVTINTPYHTGSYTGGHSIFVSGWRYNAALSRDEYLVGDPGRGTSSNPLGYVWWPAWLLYKAAESRSGSTAIYLLVGRDTEGGTIISTTTAPIKASATNGSATLKSYGAGRYFTGAETVRGGSWTFQGRTAKAWTKVSRDGVTGYLAGNVMKGV